MCKRPASNAQTKTASRQRVHEATAHLRARLRRGRAHRIPNRHPVPPPLGFVPQNGCIPAIRESSGRGGRRCVSVRCPSPHATGPAPAILRCKAPAPRHAITNHSKILRSRILPGFRALRHPHPGTALAMVRFPPRDRHNRSAREISVSPLKAARRIAKLFDNRIAPRPFRPRTGSKGQPKGSPLLQQSTLTSSGYEGLSSGSNPENPEKPDKTILGVTHSIGIL